MPRGLVTVLIAVVIWFLPSPAGIDIRAWHLFAIFFATIIGLILQPLPMGAVVIVAVAATTVTGTLPIAEALVGYSNATVWLIVAAFLFARAFTKTGLGRRIAYIFIRMFGHRTLGLGYALALTDLVLAPGIPSGTARTGGVLFPVVKSLSTTYGSEPGPTANRIGTFLMSSTFNVHAVNCAMFLTAMVANPLIVELAKTTVGVEITWIGWARAAFVPGVISFLLVPYLVFLMTKPEIRETPEAAIMARAELSKMGRMTRGEWSLLAVFLLAFSLWITGSWTGINGTVVALVALCLMLILNAISWDDVLAEHAGWNALVWFGGLISMTEGLSRLGLVSWFSMHVSGIVEGWSWMPALAVLGLVYIYSHYLFASITAHTTAFYVPLLTIAAAAGAPPYVAALVFAFLSSFAVILTPYSGGPSAVYFGGGYIGVKKWWTVDFVISIVLLVIWMGIGPIWWKALGLF